ncbi:glycosyltransferase family 31 protein [Pleomassaria siparia CBS 279.74]|uniref:N-acetylgalactosaminide beta-1,3-galactosyltransferase n=1 Tax=Pleomassaria siparia CBS 279.74 TaxID=1314801 RepID=A0A6G1JWH0_9PLEO|nr:glycosyltransferase family 31 protein [Pleomassaria siparia CBS 279.74]
MVRLTPTRLLSAAVLAFAFILIAFVSKRLFGERGYQVLLERPSPALFRHPPPKVPFGIECSPFASGVMDDVTIVLKLSASEVKTKLPAYLNRLGRCKQDLLLFSDRKEQRNGFDITDALANLRPEYTYKNPDFELYNHIQQTTGSSEKTPEGWKLDKYKFLPMMELTAHMRPESRWFLFVELDTYINWDNLYRFLVTFNPKQPYYFGSPIWPSGRVTFAHGGSGLVLSRGALNKLVARGRMFAENQNNPGAHLFGKEVSQMCCGDEILGQVLKECGVGIKGYWPMFNGEKPISVRFDHEQWCEAIITLHHLQDDDFINMQQWEADRPHPEKPLTFEELFGYIEPLLTSQTDDWTNMSEDVTFANGDPAAISFDTCFAACLKDTKCMQYEHYGDTCRLSHSIRLGYAHPPEGSTKWTSGWVKNRIEAFKAARSPCHGAHFVHANP